MSLKKRCFSKWAKMPPSRQIELGLRHFFIKAYYRCRKQSKKIFALFNTLYMSEWAEVVYKFQCNLTISSVQLSMFEYNFNFVKNFPHLMFSRFSEKQIYSDEFYLSKKFNASVWLFWVYSYIFSLSDLWCDERVRNIFIFVFVCLVYLKMYK